MATPEQYMAQAEFLGVSLSPEQQAKILSGASLTDLFGEQYISEKQRAWAISNQNPGFNPQGSNIGNNTYDPNRGSVEEAAMRKYADELMAGKYDLNLNDLQTRATAEIPRQYSQMNSAQASSMAANGLSGSGLSARAARQSQMDENSSWNSAMSGARDTYRNNMQENRQKAWSEYGKIGETIGQRKAAAAMLQQTKRDEDEAKKNKGDAAGDFFSGFGSAFG